MYKVLALGGAGDMGRMAVAVLIESDIVGEQLRFSTVLKEGVSATSPSRLIIFESKVSAPIAWIPPTL